MEWRRVSLAEVAQIVMGQSPAGETYNEGGDGLPFFQGKAEFGDLFPTTRKWCSAPTRVAEAGDVLLSVRAPVGPTNTAPERCCIGRGLAAIRANPRYLDQGYLRWFLRHEEPLLSKRGQGSTFAAINRNDISSLQLAIPPLSEQRRIVEILDKADRLRRLRTEADAKVNRILPAVFIKMFGNPATNPMGWITRPLGELTEHITSGSRGWAKHTGRGEAFFVRTQDIDNGEISSRLLPIDPPAGAESERTRLSEGDVVITITGVVGKAAVLRDSFRDLYVSQHVALVRPCREHLHPEYLVAYANLPLGDIPVLARFQYGQTKPGLGFRELRTARIQIPPPYLQWAFAERSIGLRGLQDGTRRCKRALQSLWKSTLHRAFSAELTTSWREDHMKELLQEMKQQAQALATG